ncbi:hypothetical protein ZIOFF_055263 [Zingiber officinale]|uniref:Uncharacterized protein n=1 Tax=Zingiber officinale TaxID=94328 RepID=A0A8J5FET0_ZINOF|nr:hypothetical protein ZIOFF_055263 [Zingiber officinale]
MSGQAILSQRLSSPSCLPKSVGFLLLDRHVLLPPPPPFSLLPFLPPGILPDTVKSFSVASNGYFVIDLYGECYVDFEYVVYYAPRVSGFLGYDSVSNLEGVQIRSYLIWYGVSYIKSEISVPASSVSFTDSHPERHDKICHHWKSAIECQIKLSYVTLGQGNLISNLDVSWIPGHSVKGFRTNGSISEAQFFVRMITDITQVEIIYVEACESGSIFEGLMPKDLNVYVTIASNAVESSWGTYCPGMDPPPPPEYMTCLGDLYSVAWMEDRLVFRSKIKSLSNNIVAFTNLNYSRVEIDEVRFDWAECMLDYI